MIKTLWEKKGNKFELSSWYKPTILIDIASTFYGITLLFGLVGTDWGVEFVLMTIEALASFTIGIVNFRNFTKDFLLSKTVDYELNENGIVLTWGFWNREREIVPYEELSKITIESGAASIASSILIFCENELRYCGYDASISRRRNIPAIEDVEDMDSLIAIFQNQRESKNLSFEISDQRSKRDERHKYVGENLNVSRNFAVSRTYLFLVVIIGLYFIDVNILTGKWHKDEIVWPRETKRYVRHGIVYKYCLKNHETFTTSKLIGVKGDKVEVSTSKMYGSINGLVKYGDDISETIMSGFMGVSKVVYLTTCVFLLLGSYYIGSREGIILTDHIGLAFVVPLGLLGLSIITWLYMNVHYGV